MLWRMLMSGKLKVVYRILTSRRSCVNTIKYWRQFPFKLEVGGFLEASLICFFFCLLFLFYLLKQLHTPSVGDWNLAGHNITSVLSSVSAVSSTAHPLCTLYQTKVGYHVNSKKITHMLMLIYSLQTKITLSTF